MQEGACRPQLLCPLLLPSPFASKNVVIGYNLTASALFNALIPERSAVQSCGFGTFIILSLREA